MINWYEKSCILWSSLTEPPRVSHKVVSPHYFLACRMSVSHLETHGSATLTAIQIGTAHLTCSSVHFWAPCTSHIMPKWHAISFPGAKNQSNVLQCTIYQWKASSILSLPLIRTKFKRAIIIKIHLMQFPLLVHAKSSAERMGVPAVPGRATYADGPLCLWK